MRPRPVSDQRIKEQFAIIEAVAVAGERCPQNAPYGPLSSDAVAYFYATGMISGEISGRNFRRMTLLVGPHAGRATAPDPNGNPVWKRMGVRPFKILKKVLGVPSPPRPLTRRELGP